MYTGTMGRTHAGKLKENKGTMGPWVGPIQINLKGLNVYWDHGQDPYR